MEGTAMTQMERSAALAYIQSHPDATLVEIFLAGAEFGKSGNTISVDDSDNNTISNGKHYLSGIGEVTIHDDWQGDLEYTLLCIDGKTYGAYVDPSDGYRSYGSIVPMPDHKCQYTFEPQEVIAENILVSGSADDIYATTTTDQHLLKLYDNGREVLTIGTDYAEDYYPVGIFHWCPENLSVNQGR